MALSPSSWRARSASRCCGGASSSSSSTPRACAAALCACPWLTLLSVSVAAVGVALFDLATRAALGRAQDAANIIAGRGLDDAVHIATQCLNAVTVVRATCVCAACVACARARGARTAWVCARGRCARGSGADEGVIGRRSRAHTHITLVCC
jgi:hypothetical protein